MRFPCRYLVEENRVDVVQLNPRIMNFTKALLRTETKLATVFILLIFLNSCSSNEVESIKEIKPNESTTLEKETTDNQKTSLRKTAPKKTEKQYTDIPIDRVSVSEAKSLLLRNDFLFDDKVSDVPSSWITFLRFVEDEEGHSLVEMRTLDSRYYYHMVPRRVWNEWNNSSSYGSFFNSRIKGNYQLK